jgi:hypothetical protein
MAATETPPRAPARPRASTARKALSPGESDLLSRLAAPTASSLARTQDVSGHVRAPQPASASRGRRPPLPAPLGRSQSLLSNPFNLRGIIPGLRSDAPPAKPDPRHARHHRYGSTSSTGMGPDGADKPARFTARQPDAPIDSARHGLILGPRSNLEPPPAPRSEEARDMYRQQLERLAGRRSRSVESGHRDREAAPAAAPAPSVGNRYQVYARLRDGSSRAEPKPLPTTDAVVRIASTVEEIRHVVDEVATASDAEVVQDTIQDARYVLRTPRRARRRRPFVTNRAAASSNRSSRRWTRRARSCRRAEAGRAPSTWWPLRSRSLR